MILASVCIYACIGKVFLKFYRLTILKKTLRDFPDGPVVKNLPSNAGNLVPS